jgi:hypothetical protein
LPWNEVREKWLVKRDGRWWSRQQSSNQSPWGIIDLVTFLTGLLNSRLRVLIMENPKDTLNSYTDNHARRMKAVIITFTCVFWNCSTWSLRYRSIGDLGGTLQDP